MEPAILVLFFSIHKSRSGLGVAVTAYWWNLWVTYILAWVTLL
jgi:hypothetical protein